MFLKRYFSKQIDEISRVRGLGILGGALALTHVLTGYYWMTSSLFGGIGVVESEPICWPFYSACTLTREFVYQNAFVFSCLLLLSGFASAFSFFTKRFEWGYSALLFATVLKTFILFQDYRLMGNYHYMSLYAVVFFLFIPDRVQTFRFLIPIFYISAGMLKLNPEWLSGGALLNELAFPKVLHYPALFFVLILELILVPTLVFVRHRSPLWWFAVLNLVAFHLISFHIVGYFYPAIMSCILVYYFVCHPEPQPRMKTISIVALVLLAIPQLMRTFLYPDSSIDGRGRTLALNMLDATPECHAHFIVRSGNATAILPLEIDVSAPRVRCDPIVMQARLEQLCNLQSSEGPIEVDLALETRIVTETDFRRVLDLRNACTHRTSLSFLGGVEQ